MEEKENFMAGRGVFSYRRRKGGRAGLIFQGVDLPAIRLGKGKGLTHESWRSARKKKKTE